MNTRTVDSQQSLLMNILLAFTLTANSFATPVHVPPSSRSYGSNGPWTALTIWLGSYTPSTSDSWQSIDVYPGGYFTTWLPSSSLCSGDQNCGVGGQFSPLREIPAGLNVVWQPGEGERNGTAGSVYLRGEVLPQSITFPDHGTWSSHIVRNSTIASITDGHYNIGNGGATAPIELGSLTLGADRPWEFDSIDTWPPPLYYARQSITASNSFGLHIGSAALNYTASMYYGGYDRGRTIGPVLNYGRNAPYLQDIVLGVETGGSPFSSNITQRNMQVGLLMSEQGIHEAVPISFQPDHPYLWLPRQTCDKVASSLPVTYDASINLYLWNVEDPTYEAIVSSPAYLGFVIAGPNSQNITIKVPFKVLDLTLEPLYSGKQSAVKYFPCQPYENTELLVSDEYWPTTGTYVLGKSFLQAAFLGRNWGNGRGWLAQAPGPGAIRKGLEEEIMEIQSDDTEINVHDESDLFASSWESSWTVLPDPDAPDPDTPGRGLSTGAKAGIGVAVGIVALAIIAALIFFLWKRKKNHEPQEYYGSQKVDEVQSPETASQLPEYYPQAVSKPSAWGSDPQEVPAHR